MKKFLLLALPFALVGAATMGACARRSAGGAQTQLLEIAESRGLSPEDVAHAIKTFVPPGGRDDYMLFASGGHSGQVHVIGVPSMRLLKTIAVFTPEPWQGYGYGADWSEMSLAGEGSGNDHGPHAGANGNGNGIGNGNNAKEPLRWGDSHHPALSETAGKYDGRWLYINDQRMRRVDDGIGVAFCSLQRLPGCASPATAAGAGRAAVQADAKASATWRLYDNVVL